MCNTTVTTHKLLEHVNACRLNRSIGWGWSSQSWLPAQRDPRRCMSRFLRSIDFLVCSSRGRFIRTTQIILASGHGEVIVGGVTSRLTYRILDPLGLLKDEWSSLLSLRPFCFSHVSFSIPFCLSHQRSDMSYVHWQLWWMQNLWSNLDLNKCVCTCVVPETILSEIRGGLLAWEGRGPSVRWDLKVRMAKIPTHPSPQVHPTTTTSMSDPGPRPLVDIIVLHFCLTYFLRFMLFEILCTDLESFHPFQILLRYSLKHSKVCFGVMYIHTPCTERL